MEHTGHGALLTCKREESLLFFLDWTGCSVVGLLQVFSGG